MTKKGKNLLIWKSGVTMNKKDAYKRNKMQPQNHSLTFIHKNKSLLSATSILSRSPMAYTTASLDKLTCTDYFDFANVKTDLDNFLGPKTIPTTWMLNSNIQER